ADIYLTTSDYQEGWGAVINEAMNSGCAVVANKAMGAASYLIDHGRNGFLYHNGKKQELFECVKKLLEDARLRETMGRFAYQTILEEWNGNVAADRVYKLAEDFLAGRKPIVYKAGPLSKV
ncbi:MAG: glycosyltransferase family 4 protein, partial [Lachnospiraceae bacterium]|nr:glycosyltransferase family 4 protein [Lachnospiraceae bacterium]